MAPSGGIPQLSALLLGSQGSSLCYSGKTLDFIWITYSLCLCKFGVFGAVRASIKRPSLRNYEVGSDCVKHQS